MSNLREGLDPGRETVSLRGRWTSPTWVRGLGYGYLPRTGQPAFYKVA